MRTCGDKMFDAIMILIIMITVLNYAGNIKVDLNIMMIIKAIGIHLNTMKTNLRFSPKNKTYIPIFRTENNVLHEQEP